MNTSKRRATKVSRKETNKEASASSSTSPSSVAAAAAAATAEATATATTASTTQQQQQQQYISSSAVETLLRDETKGTVEMRASLRGLQRALTCPLCSGLFQDPVTFPACGHSFCRNCIDTYSCDNWKCPVEGCGLPFSLQQKGSFRRVHPALQTSIDSFTTICQTLQKAKPYWWKDGDNNFLSSTQEEGNDNDYEAAAGNEENGDDEMIDLMASSNNQDQDDDNDRNNNNNSNRNDDTISPRQSSFLSDDSDVEEELFQSAREEDEVFESAQEQLSFQSAA